MEGYVSAMLSAEIIHSSKCLVTPLSKLRTLTAPWRFVRDSAKFLLCSLCPCCALYALVAIKALPLRVNILCDLTFFDALAFMLALNTYKNSIITFYSYCHPVKSRRRITFTGLARRPLSPCLEHRRGTQIPFPRLPLPMLLLPPAAPERIAETPVQNER